MGSGGQREDVTESSVAGIAPHMTRLFGAVTPEPDNTLTRPSASPTAPLRRAPNPARKSHLTQRGFDWERVRQLFLLGLISTPAAINTAP